MIPPVDARRSMIVAEANQWFVLHRAGALTDAQCAAFTMWLKSSPDHIEEYLVLTAVAEEMSEVLKMSPIPAEELIRGAAGLDARDGNSAEIIVLGGTHRPAQNAVKPRVTMSLARSRRWGLGVCTATLLILVTLGVANWWGGRQTDYSTVHAEQRSWRLPDGSMLHLNSDTTVKVQFDKSERRVLLIKGQAVFQVAKDPNHPFVVRAGTAIVRAVGTEFDVYRKPAGDTVISVIEGRVAVADAHLSDSEILASHPRYVDGGQQVRVNGGKVLELQRGSGIRQPVAWLQRQVIFDHNTLESAAFELNRYNDLQIRILDPQLAAILVSGNFSAYDAEAFVKFLERQSGIRVTRNGKYILVSASPIS